MIKKLTLIILCLCVFKSYGQDTHYWSSDYSAASPLVPGGVITYNRDSGVVFFNPALLAYAHKNSANISGNLYQLQSIRIKDGAGTGRNLTSTSPSIVPQLVSGAMHFKGKKPFTIGYALVQEHVLNYLSTQQFDGKINALDDRYSPGDEFYLGQYSLQNKISETAGILSGGFKISQNMAMGFAAEARLHSQLYNSDKSLRAIENRETTTGLPPIVSSQESYQAKVTHAGIRFKMGLSYDKSRHHIGLLLTSPLLKLYSSGSILSDNALSNLILYPDDDGSGAPIDTINLLVNARQQKLKSNWKMPFSVALGYAYDFERGQISITSEYFSNVSEYNILSGSKDFTARPATEINSVFTSDFFRLKDARVSVLNFGMGFSYQLKPNLTGYISARYDKSYADLNAFKQRDEDGNELGFISHLSYWDNIHWQVGANVKRRKFNLRAGLLFTRGYTDKYIQPVNFDSPREDNFLEGDTHNTQGRNLGVKLLLSYMYNF